MMATEDLNLEKHDNEMGSLFEGMVLFNSSQMEAHDEHNHDDLDHSQQQQSLVPPDPAFPPSYSTIASLSSSSSVSQPLDENLFSDLTLITPLETLAGIERQSDSDPSRTPTYTTTTTTTSASASTTSTSTARREEVLPPPQPPPISRQISTKKKKRAGLKIGYGRDAQIPDDQTHSLESEHPQTQSSPSLPSSSSSVAAQEEEEEEEQQQQQQETRDSYTNSVAFPLVHPDSDSRTPTTTSAVGKTSQGIDSSHTGIGNGTSLRVAEAAAEASEDIGGGEENLKNVSSSSTIGLRFEQIRAQISEKLKHAREVVVSVSAARKNILRRRRKAADNLSLVSAKYREMEKELEEACEAEDFEAADRVSEGLATAEKEKELLAIALRDAEADCDAVDYKMHEVLQWQITAEEECASLLRSFAMDAGNNADLVLKNAEVLSLKEMGEWLSSTEDLEVKKMELEIESHLINDAQLVFNDSLEHSVKDDRRERELLCKKKEMLTDELQRLLALVKLKEAEIAENDADVENVETRIAGVVSSFQEVQSSINRKYNNLQLDLSQIELHSEALSRKKKEIDDFLSQEEDRGAKIRELSRISADEANVYQEAVGLRMSLVQFISKSREDKVRLAKTGKRLSEDVQLLKQEMSAARASLQELSSTKSSIQQEIDSFRQRLLFIDKRVPELEAEKKVAASLRNFKEASRIATEAKTLCVEKESIQIKMKGSMSELGKLEEEILNTVKRLQEIEVQLSSKENELAMTRFQRLLLIAGSATAERSAALELGDLEEADILLGEAEAADSEARKLQPIYNLKDEEFENLPKHFISMELVSNLGGKQLVELAASARISAL